MADANQARRAACALREGYGPGGTCCISSPQHLVLQCRVARSWCAGGYRHPGEGSLRLSGSSCSADDGAPESLLRKQKRLLHRRASTSHWLFPRLLVSYWMRMPGASDEKPGSTVQLRSAAAKRIFAKSWIGPCIGGKQRSTDAFSSKGNFAEANAGGIKDGVTDCSRHNGDGCFTCAGCRNIRAIDQDCVDGRQCEIEIKAVVGFPISGCDSFVVPLYFFQQCAAHALQNAAFGLVAQTVRV